MCCPLRLSVWQVDDQNVFAQSAELMSCQLFIIEREAPEVHSVIRWGGCRDKSHFGDSMEYV